MLVVCDEAGCSLSPLWQDCLWISNKTAFFIPLLCQNPQDLPHHNAMTSLSVFVVFKCFSSFVLWGTFLLNLMMKLVLNCINKRPKSTNEHSNVTYWSLHWVHMLTQGSRRILFLRPLIRIVNVLWTPACLPSRLTDNAFRILFCSDARRWPWWNWITSHWFIGSSALPHNKCFFYWNWSQSVCMMMDTKWS